MKTLISTQALKLLLVASLALGIGITPVRLLAEEHVKEHAVAKQVNINKADAQTIADLLVGIGVAKAKAIVKFRESHGPFKSIDQLQEVNGIGEASIASNRQRITLE